MLGDLNILKILSILALNFRLSPSYKISIEYKHYSEHHKKESLEGRRRVGFGKGPT